MSFVRLENLNDFIQPGSSCVKPIEKKNPGVVAKVADVSLTDCLACSGCITSAETVLVQQQNYEELFKVINANKTSMSKKDIVVSLSLQSISSIAYKYQIEPQEAAERMASFFVSLGCSKVYDINVARQLSLMESLREYQGRKLAGGKFPLISSVCPGWVCYVEKTNGDLVIPYLSRVRSPQQIMGAILKGHLRTIERKTRNDIYHISLMPCFDKKLEASRQDFKDESDGSQDVDCVLTPVELMEILNDEGVSLLDFDRRILDTLYDLCEPFNKPLTSHIGSGSGGYAENLLLAEASEKLGLSTSELGHRLEYTTVRNSDFIEIHLRMEGLEDRQVNLSKYAIINGFRNIQTVVQRLKRNTLKYDYVEIMACPSGCVNGGAQCRPNEGDNQLDAAATTLQLYKSVPVVTDGLNPANDINSMILKNTEAIDGKTPVNQLLYTNFHAVPKMHNLSVNW